MFSDLLSDIISIVKKNGETFENVRASVQGNKIFIHDINLPLEETDKIYRKLPNGLLEAYVISDTGFISDPFGGSLSHFEVKVQKEKSIAESQYKQIILNLRDNARININSTDNSINVLNADDVFNELRKEIESIKNEMVKNNALKTLSKMELVKNKPDFTGLYMKFMGILADHLTIAPVIIQALTRFFP
jgi:hypothetical protein